jgi:hypothetical protein
MFASSVLYAHGPSRPKGRNRYSDQKVGIFMIPTPDGAFFLWSLQLLCNATI